MTDEPYKVSWHLPGHEVPAKDTGFPLFTYHPDEVPQTNWLDNIDEDHTLPAIGPSNALRILLSVMPYESKVSPYRPLSPLQLLDLVT